MPSVIVKDDFNSALRRFKRACEKAGTLSELRRKQRHIKKSEERKNNRAAAVKREAKDRQKERAIRERERARGEKGRGGGGG